MDENDSDVERDDVNLPIRRNRFILVNVQKKPARSHLKGAILSRSIQFFQRKEKKLHGGCHGNNESKSFLKIEHKEYSLILIV